LEAEINLVILSGNITQDSSIRGSRQTIMLIEQRVQVFASRYLKWEEQPIKKGRPYKVYNTAKVHI